MSNDKNWILHILCVITIIFVVTTLFTVQKILKDIAQIKNMIEQHSVHPIYGNYKKRDAKGNTCSPWDSCK